MKSYKGSTLIVAGVLSAISGGVVVRVAQADQPEMQTALSDLQAAKTALQSAAHDHGGHRRKAVEATEAAIKEVQAGIAWAEQHPKETEPGSKNPEPKQPKGPQPK